MLIAGAQGQELSAAAHAFDAAGGEARSLCVPRIERPMRGLMQKPASEAIPFGAILR
ncbi:MAG: hypothetical protein AB7V13_05920 [Pseudorhodoplanes sp.]